jgi:hypothetical protein
MWKAGVEAHYKTYVHVAGISVPYKALPEQTLFEIRNDHQQNTSTCVHQAGLFKHLQWKTTRALLSQTGAPQYEGFEVLPHSRTRRLVLVNWD